MRTRGEALAAVVCAAVLSSASAFADTIFLKNGSRLEGIVVKTVPGEKCEPCRGAGEVRCPACAKLPGGAPCKTCKRTRRVKCSACKGRGADDGSVVILLRDGARITIPKSDIASITKKAIPPEELMPPRSSYAARVAGLAEDDARGHLALARWAFRRGLFDEASKHARRAAELAGTLRDSALRDSALRDNALRDNALRNEARKILQAADDKRVGAAAAGVTAALEHVRAGRLAKGLAALDAALRDHAENPLLTDPARERAFFEGRASDVAARYGSTFERVRRSLRRRVDLACEKCSGLGSSACAACAGSGRGSCARCGGRGETWCLECNGRESRVCVRCGGTGKPHGTQLGLSARCPGCKGRGIVKCLRCKKGQVVCKVCGGKGKVARGCKRCAGTGSIACVTCLGMGTRGPTLLGWGPAPEIEPGPVIAARGATDGTRIPVWQGLARGCIVTAIRAEDLHDGALSEQLAAVIGERRDIFLVCIDNRDGRDQVEFTPGAQGLRLVTGDARQVDSTAPPDVKALAAKHPRLAPALNQLLATAVLPGATACVAGAFPDGTDFVGAKAVYWGRRKPLRLVRHYVSAEMIARIRKTMR